MATASSTTKTRYVASTFPENPLPTSDFSPPASCSGVYLTNNVFAIDNDLACLPNKWNGASTAFYSPGTACPTGYTAQPQCSRNGGVRTVTTVTCCPYRAGITLSCVENDLTLAGPWETQFCTWMAGPATVVEYSISRSGSVERKAATMSNRDGINAWGIRMVYQESDLVPSLVSATTTMATTGTGTATGIAGTTATGAVTGTATTSAATSISTGDSSSESSSGLSLGGIIGVAVAVPVVFMAALAGLFFWWRKRKHAYAGVQQPTPSDTNDPSVTQQSAYTYQGSNYQGSSYPASEMAGGSIAGYYQNDKVLMNPGQAGAGQHQQFKAYPHVVPAELPVGHGPAELDGGGMGGNRQS
ncbi:transmembrane alpha-helix domain-containing protein [Colletotrichum truncatum]|uniref:Transmembrane alpha-helix domain-containing protein n=1 Tax=Colletotrichum truncatum TaxID=5467 RepID=A0ACC3YZ62_COLTU|nr:transmembrane alpha-helix domain-containing protein [Colletotrichum truncatum]KAF6786309.1 transmembrane alpha-helix domain-containing protein [Colletotrichum truncatum]